MANDKESPSFVIPPMRSLFAQLIDWGNANAVFVSMGMGLLAIGASAIISSQQIYATFEVEEYSQKAESYREILSAENEFQAAFRRVRVHRFVLKSLADGCVRNGPNCKKEEITRLSDEWELHVENLVSVSGKFSIALQTSEHLWREDVRGFSRQIESLLRTEEFELLQAKLTGASQGKAGITALPSKVSSEPDKASEDSAIFDKLMESYVSDAYDLKRALASELDNGS